MGVGSVGFVGQRILYGEFRCERALFMAANESGAGPHIHGADSFVRIRLQGTAIDECSIGSREDGGLVFVPHSVCDRVGLYAGVVEVVTGCRLQASWRGRLRLRLS